MESYPTRFLTARQERTEVVTRAGLVFSIHDREGVFLLLSRRNYKMDKQKYYITTAIA